jgi:hypothetical protein
MENPLETVTPSEIADWIFCPEALRLRELGNPSANQPRMDAGTAYNVETAHAEVKAGSHRRGEQLADPRGMEIRPSSL